jgi:hypothetical protein
VNLIDLGFGIMGLLIFMVERQTKSILSWKINKRSTLGFLNAFIEISRNPLGTI